MGRRSALRRGVTLLLVGLAMLLGGAPLRAGGPPPPHLDPDRSPPQFSLSGFFAYIGQVLDLLVRREYSEARALALLLDRAYLPDEVRFLLERLKGLYGDLTDSLDRAESAIGRARNLALQARWEEAESALEEASASLASAREDLGVLRETFDLLEERLLGAGRLPREDLKAEMERLQSLLKQVEALWEQIRSAWRVVEEAVAERVPPPEVEARPSLKVAVEPLEPAPPGAILEVPYRVAGAGERVRLEVELQDQALALEAPPEGTLILPLPPDLPPGTYTLVLRAREGSAGGEARVPLEVQALPIRVDLKAPRLLWFRRAVPLEGTARSERGPVTGARARARLGPREAWTVTDEAGRFRLSLPLPWWDLLPGPRTVWVEVWPREAWLRSTVVEVRFLPLSPFYLLLVGLALGVGVALAWRRPGAIPRPSPAPPPLEEGPEAPPSMSPPAPAPRPLSLPPGAERVLRAYLRALRAVERRTGVRLVPSMTLREFLRAVEGRVSPAFARLTALAERVLYGRPPFPPEWEGEAQRLAHEVGGEE